jgi:hypothetical protein
LALRGKKWREEGKYNVMSFITCKFRQLLLGVIKSGRMRWTGHAARMGEMRNTYKENLKGRDYSEDLGIDRRIILEWILGM